MPSESLVVVCGSVWVEVLSETFVVVWGSVGVEVLSETFVVVWGSVGVDVVYTSLPGSVEGVVEASVEPVPPSTGLVAGYLSVELVTISVSFETVELVSNPASFVVVPTPLGVDVASIGVSELNSSSTDFVVV